MSEQASDRPTLAAVAARAGVSASTASLAFSGAGPVSEATKAKVLAAAAELNYGGPDPRAQSLRRGRSGIVGVVLEENVAEAFTDPMNIATLGGIAEAIAVNGSALLLLTENYDGPSNLRTAPLDAVVLIGCSTRLVDAVHVFTQRGVPIVGIETEPMDGVVRVDIDNRGGTAVLAGHLRDLGHEDVVLVTLALDADHTTGWITPDREAASEGYTASQRILGARDVFPESRAYSASTSSVDDGYRAGAAVLAESTPTAIIAQSDLLAIGVIRAATEAGLRVPEDLSVVGFDGIRLDGIAPHDLTTMVQPAVDKGLSAGRAVVDLVEGLEPEPAWFDSEFHRGTTTAPPRR